MTAFTEGETGWPGVAHLEQGLVLSTDGEYRMAGAWQVPESGKRVGQEGARSEVPPFRGQWATEVHTSQERPQDDVGTSVHPMFLAQPTF